MYEKQESPFRQRILRIQNKQRTSLTSVPFNGILFNLKLSFFQPFGTDGSYRSIFGGVLMIQIINVQYK